VSVIAVPGVFFSVDVQPKGEDRMRQIRCSIAFFTVFSILICGCGGPTNTTLQNDPKVSEKIAADYKQKMEEAMKNKAAPEKPKYGGPK
jgi:hypothetical protein